MMIRFHADPRSGLPSELFKRVKHKVELALGVDTKTELGREVPPDEYDADTIKLVYDDMIPLKGMPGYYMAWGGEAEDSVRATEKPGLIGAHVLRADDFDLHRAVQLH
jgi:hypothetical protein